MEGRTVSDVLAGPLCIKHINDLEIRAVLLVLKHFNEVIEDQFIILETENTQ